MRTVLAQFGVTLLIDPLGHGDDVVTRIRTFEFDALLFLLCEESWASKMCQLELATARQSSKPVLVAHLGGPVPPAVKAQIYLTPTDWESLVIAEVAPLAQAIRRRASFASDLRSLNVDLSPYDSAEIAQRLATQTDRNVLAEHAEVIAQVYGAVIDASTRYWLAIALGQAGTREAVVLLKSLRNEDHPYALEGIREALAMIGSQPT